MGSPSAFRVIASTTKIFVNDDIISSSAGATDSSVMPMSTITEVDGAPFAPPMVMETAPDPALGVGVGTVGFTGSANADSGEATTR